MRAALCALGGAVCAALRCAWMLGTPCQPPVPAGAARCRRRSVAVLEQALPACCGSAPCPPCSQQFGVSHFLVSQCNPWLLPLVALKEVRRCA